MNNFSFNSDNLELANEILKKYPSDRKQSAVMPFLDLAQRQNGGWLSKSSIEYIAKFLDMPYIKVFEVVTFSARSKFFNPFHFIVEFEILLILNLPFLEQAIVPFGAPLSLIKLVKLLVSKPVIPTILFFLSQESKC